MTSPRLPASEHEPFVLLDDASRHADGATAGQALLFRDPVGIVRAERMDEVMPALAEVARAADYGLHAAGYISYTAGHAFEPRTADYRLREGDSGPLLWFGLFVAPQVMPATTVPDLLPAPDLAATGGVMPMITQAEYDQAIGKVLDYIVAGDIYQANLTFPAAVDFPGDPLAAYAAIRPRQRAGHGGLIRHDGRHVLSFSPESFFAMAHGQIVTRPMKGTARRFADAARDAAAIAELASDPKQRAENLMIVDLLRNDISRVAEAGSVAVPALFSVETYPTIHQMISVVEGRVRPGLGPDEVIRALFPCGSITGAPKLRAMQVIDEVERFGRGLYTGSIGHIAPDGAARFNVAIRTISVETGARHGVLGLGSGVVADSRPDAEWQECLDKSRFVVAQ